MSSRQRTVLAMTILFFVVLIGATVGLLVRNENNVQSYNGTETSASGYIGDLTPNSSALSASVATALLNKVGALGYSGTANARNMNNGTTVIFKMAGYYWQVVYRTNDYLTVWMTQGYNSTTYSTGDGPYSNSTMRSSTLSAYNTLKGNYPLIDNFIATPQVAAYSWQNSQTGRWLHNNYTSCGDGLSGCMSDKFWIPSFVETCNNTSTNSGYPGDTDGNGLWGLNNTEKTMSNGGDTLLRSGCTNGTAKYFLKITSSQVNGWSSSAYLRPACHISLQTLAESFYYDVVYDDSCFANKVGALAGGFENTGWQGGTYDTTHVRSGQYAYKVTASTSVWEQCIYTLQELPLDATTKTHKYYAQYWGYQEDATGTQTTQIYWPVEEPSFGQPSLGAAGQWNMYSYYCDRNSNPLTGSKLLRIDFDNNNVANSFWVDDFLLVDLTEIFGAGNEPTKAWCDANIRTGVSTQRITKNTATALTSHANTNSITGATFAGWSTTPRSSLSWPSATYTNGQSVTDLVDAGETIVLYGVWRYNTYTITLDNQSATTAGTTSVTATYNSAMPAISIPVRTGYTFGGYYTSANGGGTQYYTASGASAKNCDLTAATTLYAKWTLSTYTLTANAMGGSIPTTSGWTVTNDGGSATKSVTYSTQFGALPTPTKSGYTFGGWYFDLKSMGYTPLSYIQSSANGSECINTGYAWENENIRIVCDAYAPSAASAESLFGTEEYTANSGDGRWFGGIPHSVGNGSYTIYLGVGSTQTIAIDTSSRFVIEIFTTSAKSMTVKLNGITQFTQAYSGSVKTKYACNQYDASLTPSGSYGMFYIFSNHNSTRSASQYSGTQFAHSMAVYAFKMYDNDVLVRDFVPVKNSSGVAGLYDLVTQEFYTTSSGAFTAGEEMTDEILYQKTAVTEQNTYSFTANQAIYAKWTPNIYTVTANANGGTVTGGSGWSAASEAATATKSLDFGSDYGALPSVSRTGYTFDGWYLDLTKSGYTMLEYIESTASGGEFINTNYYWHSKNIRVVADLLASSTSTGQSLFGSEEYVGNSDNRYFGCVPYGGNGQYNFYIGGSPALPGVNIGTTNRVVMDINAFAGNYIYLNLNGQRTLGRMNFADSLLTGYCTTGAQSGSFGLFYIFANHNSNRVNTNYSPTQYATNMRLYSFQMWDNGVLVRYYVPVKNSSGVAGLYDLVEDQFYTTTQGAFVAGPEGAFRLNGANVLSNAGNQTIYADWTPHTYTVSYNANGGTGNMASTTHTYGVSKALSQNTYTRAGYEFAGWSTSSSATMPTYEDGQSVSNLSATNGATVTLYAVWQIKYTITVASNLDDDNVMLLGGGVILKDSQTTISAFAIGEYILLYWLCDGLQFSGNTANTITITATADKTYTAVFGEAGDEITGVTITTRLRGQTGVTNYGTASVSSMTVNGTVYAHFYATPKVGYRFVRWELSNNDQVTYSQDVVNIAVSDIDNSIVVAVFEAIDNSHLNTELDNM